MGPPYATSCLVQYVYVSVQRDCDYVKLLILRIVIDLVDKKCVNQILLV